MLKQVSVLLIHGTCQRFLAAEPIMLLHDASSLADFCPCCACVMQWGSAALVCLYVCQQPMASTRLQLPDGLPWTQTGLDLAVILCTQHRLAENFAGSTAIKF